MDSADRKRTGENSSEIPAAGLNLRVKSEAEDIKKTQNPFETQMLSVMVGPVTGTLDCLFFCCKIALLLRLNFELCARSSLI